MCKLPVNTVSHNQFFNDETRCWIILARRWQHRAKSLLNEPSCRQLAMQVGELTVSLSCLFVKGKTCYHKLGFACHSADGIPPASTSADGRAYLPGHSLALSSAADSGWRSSITGLRVLARTRPSSGSVFTLSTWAVC